MFIARRPQPEREHTFGLGRHRENPSNPSLCHAAGEFDYRSLRVTERNEMHTRNRLKFALVAAIVAALATAVSAQAKVTDPRKCATATPGGTAKHSYWCAHNNAVAAVRAVMARKQGLAKWYSPTFCDQGATLLRWACTTINGGDRWTVTVTWRATSSGWHRYATVTKTQ